MAVFLIFITWWDKLKYCFKSAKDMNVKKKKKKQEIYF